MPADGGAPAKPAWVARGESLHQLYENTWWRVDPARLVMKDMALRTHNPDDHAHDELQDHHTRQLLDRLPRAFFFNGVTGEVLAEPPPGARLVAEGGGGSGGVWSVDGDSEDSVHGEIRNFPAPPPSAFPEMQGGKVQWNGGKFWKVGDALSNTQWTDNSKALRLLFAGGASGAVAKTCVAPLERIKMLLQVHGMSTAAKTDGAAAASPGIGGMARKVLMVDGPGGFWRGNFANVVRIVPTKGVLFFCNDYYRELFGVDPKKHDPWRLVGCGAAAGMTSTLVTYPLDLVRSRLMMMSASVAAAAAAESGGAAAAAPSISSSSVVAATEYTGIADCFRKTYRAEGIRGLYGGLGPTLCGIIPYAGVSFSSFDLLKGHMPKNEEGRTPTQYKLAAGACAGFLSQSVSYPVDTVRRRMQLQGSIGATRLYANAFACSASVWKHEGPRAFYRGLSANLLRAAPNTAIQFTAYDTLTTLLKLKNKKR